MKKVLSFMLSMFLLLSMLPTGALLVNAEPLTTKMVGDLDHDGEVTDWDGVLLARHLAGWTVTVVDEQLLDIDGDGEITDWDGVMFDRHLAGWSVVTQVGKRMAYKITYENTKDAVNTNPESYENGSVSVALTPLEAEHYTFAGWYMGDNKVTHIPTDGEGDLTITARWTPVEYTISYTNTKGAANSNPVAYHIESDTIVLQNLTLDGYAFDGWYNGNTKVTTIPSGTVGNITLTAQWTPISYTATFTADGSVVATRYFTIEDETISNIPNVPSKAGYIGAWSNYSLGTTNVVIPAIYTLNEYSITYANTKGADNSNLASYTVITDTFNLADLQCDGYEFIGWYKGNTKVTSIEKGTTGNITLTAKWSATDYIITYSETKGATNSNPVEYNVETGTIYLADISDEHYTFAGWYLNGNKVTTIPAGNIGDIELVARWTPVSYSLTYQNTKGVANTNPAAYTVEDMIILQDISADGYTFDGWYIGDEKVATIPVGSSGNKTLTAKWSVNTYSITYQDSKNLEHNGPDTYTVESNTILLPALSAPGYIFDGWYNGNKKVTSIKAGSTGDLVLTAKWSIITYTITYKNTKDVTNNNQTTYTSEDNIVLEDLVGFKPNRLGYMFDGWYIGDKKVTEIKEGTFGNLTLSAKWTPFVYSFMFTQMGNAENPNTLPDTTTVETWPGDYTLLAPTRDGYAFESWTIYTQDGLFYPNMTEITLGRIKAWAWSDGSFRISANWTPLEYSIKYTTSEKYAGILVYANSNPTTYTSGSTITLQAPAAVNGYTFEGWYEDAAYTKPITLIDKDRWGDLTLYAKYTFTGKMIYNKTDFISITYDPSGSYMLAHDIEIDDTICNSPTPFTGVFNGNGYAVTGPKEYNYSSGQYVATAKTMFGESDGLIVNTISKGGIANVNSGAIIHCGREWGQTAVVDDVVNAGAYSGVGGITSFNRGLIQACYSVGNLYTDDRTVGGIAGVNSGTIKDCYFDGYIYIDDYIPRTVGGIAGSNHGEITGCYAVGEICFEIGPNVPESYAFAIAPSDTIKDCFALVDCSGYGFSKEKLYIGGMDCDCTNCYGDNTTTFSQGNVTLVDSLNFKSKQFMTETMGWCEDVWNFQDGSLPKLAWE